MIRDIRVNVQSSIRVEASKTLYFDPWQIGEETHDGDCVFITHEHYDHFSPEDIEKVAKYEGYLIIPRSMYNLVKDIQIIPREHVITMQPLETREVARTLVEALPAYNLSKPFHIKRSGWLGYAVTIDGTKLYVSGDTDFVPELRGLTCDVAFLGIGGSYSMDAGEAAGLARSLNPEYVVPTGYGSIAGSPVDGEFFQGLLPRGMKCALLLDQKTDLYNK